MKRVIRILLAIIIVSALMLTIAACDQDPCKDGHSWDDGSITKQPTCQAEGTILKRCKICGAVEQQTLAKVGHDWGEPNVIVPPTCSTPGRASVKCKNCDETQPDEIIPATGNHVVNLQAKHEAVEATCWREGSIEYYDCQTCGSTVKLDADGNVLTDVKVAKTAHNYDNGVITKAPTCSDTGIKTFTCQNEGCTGDGHTFEQVLDKVDHVYGRLNNRVEPTCDTSGVSAYYQCEVCHKYFDESKQETEWTNLVIAALGHNYEKVDGKPATCTQDGFETYYKCNRCHGIFSREGEDTYYPLTNPVPIRAKGHEEKQIPAIEATCTKGGKTAGVECAVCGVILVTPKNTAPLGHQWGEWYEVQHPTCTEQGVMHRDCLRMCGATDEQTKSIPALGHNYVYTSDNDSVHHTVTCSRDCGYKAVEECASTGAWMSDNADYHYRKCDKCKGECDIANHTFQNKQCTVCGAEQSEVIVRVAGELDHTENSVTAAIEYIKNNYNDGTPVTIVIGATRSANADVTFDGKIKVTLDLGNFGINMRTFSLIVDEQADVTLVNGTLTGKVQFNGGKLVLSGVSGDYTIALKAGLQCDEADVTVNGTRLDHAWNNGQVTTPPTCEGTGTRTFTCTRCQATRTEDEPAKGHTYGALIPQQDSTCTATGTAAHYQCSDCHKLFIDENGSKKEVQADELVLQKLPHAYKFDNWTCDETFENATAHFSCTKCDHAEQVTVKLIAGKRTESTCTNQGKVEYSLEKDAVCGGVTAPAQTFTQTLPYAEHKYGDKQSAKQATCSEKGNKEYYQCSECKQYFVEKDGVKVPADWSDIETDIDKTNHSYNFDEWKYDGTNHWHECVYNSEHRTDVTEHDWQYSSTHDGKHSKSCKDCGIDAVVEQCTHDGGDKQHDSTHGLNIQNGWYADADNHWQICEKCGETINKGAHDWVGEEDNKTCKDCGHKFFDVKISDGDGLDQSAPTIAAAFAWIKSNGDKTKTYTVTLTHNRSDDSADAVTVPDGYTVVLVLGDYNVTYPNGKLSIGNGSTLTVTSGKGVLNIGTIEYNGGTLVLPAGEYNFKIINKALCPDVDITVGGVKGLTHKYEFSHDGDKFGFHHEYCTVCGESKEAVAGDITLNACECGKHTYTAEEIIAALNNLPTDQKNVFLGSETDTFVLSGTVESMEIDGSNTTIYITVNGLRIQAFHISGDKVNKLCVGAQVTVSGALKTYYAQREFDYATLVSVDSEPELSIDVTIENGNVKNLPESVNGRTSVTFTVEPADGYTVGTVTVNGQIVVADGDGNYTIDVYKDTTINITMIIAEIAADGNVVYDPSDIYSKETANKDLRIKDEDYFVTVGEEYQFQFKYGGGGAVPVWRTTEKEVRFYYSNTLTISGKYVFITKVVFTFKSDDGNTITADSGVFAGNTWLADSKNLKTSVTFTVGENSSGETKGQRKITEIDVYYTICKHDWQESSNGYQAPTCGKEGIQPYVCALGCGATKQDTIPATGAHSYTDLIPQQNASCKDGVKAHYECQNCDKKFILQDGEYVEQTDEQLKIPGNYEGHKWSDWIRESDPTCTTPGKQYRTCDICKTREEQEIEIDNTAHKFKPLVDETDFTFAYQQCEYCGKYFDAEGNLLGEDLTSVEKTVTFQKLTDLSMLEEGTQFIIVASNADAAMGLYISGTNIKEYAITKGDDTVSVKGLHLTVVTLEQAPGGAWYFAVDGGYLQATGIVGDKNELSVSGTKSGKSETNGDNGITWTIMLNSGGNAVIKAQPTTSEYRRNVLKYNSKSKLFSCYSSGQQDVDIYLLNACKHQWSYTANNDFTHTRHCSVCERTQTVACAPAENYCALCGATYTPQQIVDKLFSLEAGEVMPGTYKLTGEITEIVQAYNSKYGNVSFNINVYDHTIEAFRAVGETDILNALKVGDKVTVVGELQHFKDNNNENYEFSAGCTCTMYRCEHSSFSVLKEAHPATCTTPGSVAIYQCAECKCLRVGDDGDFNFPESDLDNAKLVAIEKANKAALGHKREGTEDYAVMDWATVRERGLADEHNKHFCALCDADITSLVEYELSYNHEGGATSQHTVTCPVCNYEATEGHTEKETYEVGDDQHWKVCKFCEGEIADTRANHNYENAQHQCVCGKDDPEHHHTAGATTNYIEPTCTTPGQKASVQCSGCNKYFADESWEEYLGDDVSCIKIDTVDHVFDYDHPVIVPVDNKEGYHHTQCKWYGVEGGCHEYGNKQQCNALGTVLTDGATSTTHKVTCTTCNTPHSVAHSLVYKADGDKNEGGHTMWCADCKYSEQSDGHNYPTKPTRVDEYQHQFVCTTCSYTNKQDHDWGKGEYGSATRHDCSCGEPLCSGGVITLDGIKSTDSEVHLFKKDTSSYDKAEDRLIGGVKFSYTGLCCIDNTIQVRSSKNSTLYNTTSISGLQKIVITLSKNSTISNLFDLQLGKELDASGNISNPTTVTVSFSNSSVFTWQTKEGDDYSYMRLVCKYDSATKVQTIVISSEITHLWGEGQVTQTGSCASEGTPKVTTYTCLRCGKTNVVSEKVEHAWDEVFHPDGEGNHYHECTVCHAHSDSTPCENTLTWETDAEDHRQYCTVCGYDNVAQSKHDDYFVKVDNTYHKQECQCGYKFEPQTHTPDGTGACTAKGCTFGHNDNFQIGTGGEKVGTLQEAISKAGGEDIYLLVDITLDQSSISESFKLNLGTHTLGLNSALTLSGTVTITNGTIEGGLVVTGTLTLQGVTIVVHDSAVLTVQDSGNVNVDEECQFLANAEDATNTGKIVLYGSGVSGQFASAIENYNVSVQNTTCDQLTAVTFSGQGISHSYSEYIADVEIPELGHTMICDICGYDDEVGHTLKYDNITDTTHREYCELCNYEVVEAHDGNSTCECGYTKKTETTLYTLQFGSKYNSSNAGSYENSWHVTCSGFIWDMTNFNNNSNGWSYVKAGSKSKALVAEITTHDKMPETITSIVVTIDAITDSSINSITLQVSDSPSFTTKTDYTVSKTKGEQTITISTPKANLYYKLIVDCKKSSNGVIQISKIVYKGYEL